MKNSGFSYLLSCSKPSQDYIFAEISIYVFWDRASEGKLDLSAFEDKECLRLALTGATA
jgi:hypothetical protein